MLAINPRFVLVVTGVVLSLIPMAFYAVAIGRAPSVTPAEALVLARDGRAAIVDIRGRQAFEAQHLAQAEHWPYEDLIRISDANQIPAFLRGKRLLLLCDSGILSAHAARYLRAVGVTDAASVKDGMTACTMDGRAACSLDMIRSLFSGRESVPYRDSPWYEETALVFTGFGVKPFYMFLAALLALVLWRSVSADLAALRWSMVFFFLGEGACAINYLAFNLQSHPWEYLHSLGMVLSFAFLPYALFEGLDMRLIHLSEPERRCAAQDLCGTCHQRTGGPCGLERCFLWFTAALWIVAWMPLCAPLHPVSYNTAIFGTPYNYSHHVLYQMFESRYCPVIALAFLAGAFLVLALKQSNRVRPAKVLFAAGMGPLSFSIFRLMVFGVYRDNIVWFNFWEEITEGLLITGIAIVLWVFRATLFPRRDQPSAVC